MTERQYVYKIVEVVKVTDGDTYWLRIDAGFRAHILINVRLMGYDTPEAHKGTAYEKGKAWEAQRAAWTFLTAETPHETLWVQTMKDPDNFGRWLGTIWWEDSDGTTEDLGENLRSYRLASVWPTRWRDEYNKGAETTL